MDEETVNSIIEAVLGQNVLIPTICDRYDIEFEDLEELLLDNNIEACAGCSWFFECSSLYEEENGNFCCRHCHSGWDVDDTD